MTTWLLFTLGFIVGWSGMELIRAWIRRWKLRKHYEIWKSIGKEK